MKFAFRCRNCGHLHTADHAGDNDVPHACCVCGKGVKYDGFRKTYQPENWEVLSEASTGRKFVPSKSARVISVTASDGSSAKDKA